jgi:uncharacterized repeat protein (TIGR01451 family)
MLHSTTRRLAAVLFAAALATPIAALAQAEVQVNLTAHRVSNDAQGKEVLAAGDQAKPGELLEYLAVYRNAGDASVQKLMATLPIPQGMEYVPQTAVPAPVMASVDGKTYSPVPLKRKVRLTDGREVVRDVPASEYRFLRWAIGTLPGRQEQAVRARVRVAPLVAASDDRH